MSATPDSSAKVFDLRQRRDSLVEIARRILHLRKEILALNEEQFGKKLGVSRRTVTAWETLKGQRISTKWLHKISKTFGVSLDWLLQGQGDVLPG
jgi:transcriptional regulator with XRE-family HTH domain